MNPPKKIHRVLIGLAAIISVALFNVVIVDRTSQTLEDHIAKDKTDGNGHVLTALNLIRTRSFGDTAHPYFGKLPEEPTYRLLLAGSFLVVGETMVAVYALNFLLFLGALLLWHQFSSKVLPHPWAIAPPLFLASFWGATSYVFHPNTELSTLFFVSLFFLGLSWHARSGLFATGAGFALLVLQKPILEYFYPVIIFFLLYRWWSMRYPCGEIMKRLGMFLGIGLLIVGSWHVHQYRVLESWQTKSSGIVLAMRSASAAFTGDTLKGFVLSSFLGTSLADIAIPGYAKIHEPLAIIRATHREHEDIKATGISEKELNGIFQERAVKNIKEHTFRYLWTTPFWLIRLNNPVSYDGAHMDNLFIDSHLPRLITIPIILGIRILWYGFLFIAFWEMITRVRHMLKTRTLDWLHALLIAFVLYMNGAHALFSHAEVRYILPVMPLYFLYFILSLKDRSSIAKKFIHEI